jgi:hypothetical protein
MRRRSLWNFCHSALGHLSIVASVTLVTAGACAKIPENSKLLAKPLLGPLLTWYKPVSTWLVLFLPVGIGLAELARRWIGSPWAWSAVRGLLNEFEDKLFRNKNLRRDEHSVTLFKYVRFRWKFWLGTCWLVPVERSGNARQKTRRAFRIADGGGAASEGIAGQVFSSETVLSAHDLPDLNGEAAEGDLQKYATATHVSVAWLEQWVNSKKSRGQKVPRAICGFHVETPAAKPWGVLVFDSADKDDLGRRAGSGYDMVKGQLSRLVERL